MPIVTCGALICPQLDCLPFLTMNGRSLGSFNRKVDTFAGRGALQRSGHSPI
jgi:hypothetical protein